MTGCSINRDRDIEIYIASVTFENTQWRKVNLQTLERDKVSAPIAPIADTTSLEQTH